MGVFKIKDAEGNWIIQKFLISADQEFNKESENAISNRAVGEALDIFQESVDETLQLFQQEIDAIQKFEYIVVEELPTADESTMGKVYLVPVEDPKQKNIKDEYITIKVAGDVPEVNQYFWEQIGSTSIDLSQYYTKTEIDQILREMPKGSRIVVDNTTFEIGYEIDENGDLIEIFTEVD